jgi:short-subunit dehydrogenase
MHQNARQPLGAGFAVDSFIAPRALIGDFLSHDRAAELASIQVNVQALVGLSHALGAKMVSQGMGGIINLASNAAFQPLPYMATYAAAKAFVLHFSEALKIELKRRNVQVMAVCPGPTETSSSERVSTKMKGVAFDRAEMVVGRTLRSFDQKKSVAYPGPFSVRVATWLHRLLPPASWSALPRRRRARWVWPRRDWPDRKHDNLPSSLANRAEALDAVLELRGYVEEFQAVELPKGFGRD